MIRTDPCRKELLTGRNIAGRVYIECRRVHRVHPCGKGLQLLGGNAKGGIPPCVPVRITSWICFIERPRSLRLSTSAGPRSVPVAR